MDGLLDSFCIYTGLRSYTGGVTRILFQIRESHRAFWEIHPGINPGSSSGKVSRVREEI